MNAMKRKNSSALIITLMLILLAASAVSAGCGKEKDGSGKTDVIAEASATDDAGAAAGDNVSGTGDPLAETAYAAAESGPETADEDSEKPQSGQEDGAVTESIQPDITLSVGEGKDQALTDTEPDEDISQDTAEPDTEPDEKEAGKTVNIVWLGDSLTQESLGDMDDNLEHAPYARLQKLCAERGDVVEGFGYYAYVTSDIFWRYDEFYENGDPKDPQKVYVLWVGSNDFALSPDPLSAVSEVTAQIDKFVGGGIDKYIVLSHLPRAETAPDGLYIRINEALRAKYGERFLDITSCAPFPEGYQSDSVHLTQSSYDNVADAVYDKLIRMGYI